MRDAIVVMVVVAIVGGCFDATVPPNARITCAADADCPIGRVCSEADGVCVKEGSAAPTLVDAQLVPEVAGAGEAVTLTIAAAADVASASLVLGGADPGFSAADLGGNVATFSLVVGDAAPADGFYALDAVDLADADGRARRWPRGLTLRVDRAAPALISTAATPPSHRQRRC